MRIKKSDTIKKEMCQCRKCCKVFHQSKAKIIHNKLYGKDIEERCCPECGSRNYGLIRYFMRYSIEGVYKTRKFLDMEKKYKD